MTLTGVRIHISGIVQGVGFRPFVYGLATRLALTGWVRNTSAGVDIEADGAPEQIAEFVRALRADAPPLARIDEFDAQERPTDGFHSFEIVHSEAIDEAFQPISPDVCICPDCLGELFDPHDRRYLYPFINCTNCGPRFTIIQDIPYDRPLTTMAGFALCPACAAEYKDPLDRRFHAQPVACPDCGPHVWLEERSALSGQPSASGDQQAAIYAAQRRLADGQILAIKGLGGFHLACDATQPAAVAELRRRKLRVDKPFALMMPDLATIEEHCLVSDAERLLLESRPRPIVLLRRRPGSPTAAEAAPGQETLGVMLPYTPLHYLLFARQAAPASAGEFTLVTALVMTSGNLSEEPIATDNDEARARLASLADAFLMHNRPIHVRCDDSVVRAFARPHETETVLPMRRSRGYAPFPVRLPWQAPPLLAAGAELKNTFCITHERYAFLSHHIGDLENYETLRSFEDGVAHFERLFRVTPQALAYDLHPNYLATRYALERAERQGLPAVGVQHHHAHIAACMAEHGLTGEQPVIGLAFDGTGYGPDESVAGGAAIWGGEFLIADYRSYRRAGHLAYLPLPGGDAATRRPARIALACLWQAGLDWDDALACTQALGADERRALRAQLEHRLNAPLTSSMGRLFDGVAALAGVRQAVNYEAQAAIELEALADPAEQGVYPFELRPGPDETFIADPTALIAAVLKDALHGIAMTAISARFHNGVARLALEACRRLHEQSGLRQVALSGGVWQNITLIEKTCRLLQADGFEVLLHRQTPANDGGLALGQAAVAVQTIERSICV